MGKDSAIEWTHHTHNHWIGCTHVSPGCEHCYAETMMDKRYGRVQWGKGKPRMLTSEANRRKPLAWNKAAVVSSTRPRVFSASLSDWLDDEVPIAWLADLLGLIEQTPNLDWLLLTKRIDRWSDRLHQVVRETHDGVDMFASRWLDGDAPANVWLGTSCEDQRRADERIPHLLRVPALVRFLSCEPLLGPICFDVCEEEGDEYGDGAVRWNMLSGYRWMRDGFEKELSGTAPIHWVVCGGESGAQARPMHPAWARSLRDQALAAGVAFFFKQWGETRPYSSFDHLINKSDPFAIGLDGHRITSRTFWQDEGRYPGYEMMKHVGKYRAGRLLDGVEWSQYPEVVRCDASE